jgi:prevent-host-death family protein
MREVQASEAKTHLPRLLNEVEGGATIVITRHGVAIARLVPETEGRHADVTKAVAGLRALRSSLRKLTRESAMRGRHEGHKY